MGNQLHNFHKRELCIHFAVAIQHLPIAGRFARMQLQVNQMDMWLLCPLARLKVMRACFHADVICEPVGTLFFVLPYLPTSCTPKPES